MLKRVIIFIVIFLIILVRSPVFAEVKFKDVPANHWAAKAVYDLVRLGITSGYPDGTFRGTKSITRYETAIFLSKLADKLSGADLAQLKLELDDLKNEIAKIHKSDELPLSGEYEITNKLASAFAGNGNVSGHGPLINYRLKTNLTSDLGNGSSLLVRLDTLDAGFSGGTREVFTQSIDAKGNLVLNPVDLGLSEYGFSKAIEIGLTMGSGPIQHADVSGLLPSETGYTFDRFYPGLDISTNMFGLDVSAGYFQVLKTNSGQALTSKLEGAVKYGFNNIPLVDKLNIFAASNYYFKHPTSLGIKDLRALVNLAMLFPSKAQLTTTFGFGSPDPKAMMVGAQLEVPNLFGEKSNLLIYGSKVGSEYISNNFSVEEFNVAGYDLFKRPLEAATVNLGGEIVQPFSEKLDFHGKGILRLSSDFGYGKEKTKSYATAQVGLKYEIAPSTTVDTYYRINQDPTISETTDLAAMGLVYKF